MAARKATDPTQRVLEELAIGRHDGRLTDVLQAVADRATVAGISSSWALEVDGIRVEQDDMTIDMYDLIERTTGMTWVEFDALAVAKSAHNTRTMLEAVLVFRDGMSAEDARARVGKIRLADIAKGWSSKQVDPTGGGQS